MLVQRLVAHAGNDPTAKPFHRLLRFDYELPLDTGGAVVGNGLEPITLPDAKGRERGTEHLVPAVVRTVGVAPNLAADDVQYVLGWADADSNPQRVAQCHDAFVDLTRRWADSPEGQQDRIAQAVARFYASGESGRLCADPQITAKQRVLITVDGAAAYRAPSVQSFWAQEVARRKGGGRSGLCLVCGQTRPLLDTLPGKVPARLVPGASNDAALVSINERVFGYDLTTQLACSPICITCGEGISAGLVRVLGSDDTTSFGGQDSRLAWWVTEPVKRNPMKLILGADPKQIRELIRSVHKGQPRKAADSAKFCALTVGGNVARVMVRDWLELPLTKVEESTAAWFEHSEIVTLHPEEPEYQSLERLVRVTGRWIRNEKRYAAIGAKGADRPDGVQRDLLRAALRGIPLPPSLLTHLLHRVRTDGRLDTPRAALIRLALLRLPYTTETPMPGLDPTNTDPSYVAGRLFAALDAVQHDAFEGKINTTYANRYFAGAVTNPRSALIAGRKLADAWLRKFRGPRKGIAVNHRRELDDLFDLLDAGSGIPRRANSAQQSLFLLGYHHQRAHRFKTLRERAGQRQATANPDSTNPTPATIDTEQEIPA